MNEKTKQFLRLMFKENELICISDSKYSYLALPFNAVISEKVPLISNNSKIPIKKVNSKNLIFVALNPMKSGSYRTDSGCQSFRNFLIELDDYTIDQQRRYVLDLGMPISACIYSGNKSAHFLISLSEDLKNEKTYRLLYRWILNIATLSDQALGNPSRSIRLPGAIRPETGKEQELIELKGKVTLKELKTWLLKYPNCKPEPPTEKKPISGEFNFNKLSWWTKKQLTQGLDTDKGRNRVWFAIACDMCLCGYSLDDTIDILSKFFTPDRDFKEREFLTAIRSAFKHIHESRK